MRNKSLLKTMVVVLILILICPTSVVGAQKIPDTRGISLYQISGDQEGVSVKRGEKKTFQGSEGIKLGEGDTLTTNDKAMCYLAIDQDKIVKMDKNTILRISRASSKKLRISLESGNLYFDVKKSVPKDSELEFKSGGTVMGVRGTNGFFGNQEGAIEASILTGEVQLITAQGGRIAVKGGFYQVFAADGTPDGSPKPITQEGLSAFVMETVLEEVTRQCETEAEKLRQEKIKEIFQVQNSQALEEFRKAAEEKAKEERERQAAEEARLLAEQEALNRKTQIQGPIYEEAPRRGGGSSSSSSEGSGGGDTPPLERPSEI